MKEGVRKMKDFNLLCMGCMKIKPHAGPCPYCKFDIEKYRKKIFNENIHYLQPQTILNGSYMVGKTLGQGGFGITYIGYDLHNDAAVAIKEYFPTGFVTRNTERSDTVSVLSTGAKGEFYAKQKRRFLEEAQTLAKLNHMESIVSVKNCFEENGTAYIVMEYLDGEDFKSYLRRRGGRIAASQVLEMMKPIVEALGLIHKNNNGLIHRDISPDNIRVMSDSKVKLMDFGAARETDDEKSLSILLKPGYAPVEQYRTNGHQGPWTDVYGLCATMYCAITGVKPMEALERVVDDNLKSPSQLGFSIQPEQEKALMKGLAVLWQNRWQSMDDLYKALYETEKIKVGTNEQLVKGKNPGNSVKNPAGAETVQEKISQEEANIFIDMQNTMAKSYAIPYALLCFSCLVIVELFLLLSPVFPLVYNVLSIYFSLRESIIAVRWVSIAAAIIVTIQFSKNKIVKVFQNLRRVPFDTEPETMEMIKKQKAKYEPIYKRDKNIGSCLWIFSFVLSILSLDFFMGRYYYLNGIIPDLGLLVISFEIPNLCMGIASAFYFKGKMEEECFLVLMQEGEYSRDAKSKRYGKIFQNAKYQLSAKSREQKEKEFYYARQDIRTVKKNLWILIACIFVAAVLLFFSIIK